MKRIDFDNISSFRILLVSNSPRRRELLASLGISFEVITKDIDESYPPDLKKEEIALYLAETKASAFDQEIKEHEIVITADTIVCLQQQLLNKPVNEEDAIRMLQLLSGKEHEVITAVCLTSVKKRKSFFDTTRVTFKDIPFCSLREYVKRYQPYDKAGAYGIQENNKGEKYNVLIEKIEGSYSNVMGLPVEMLQKELKKFINDHNCQ